MTAPLPIISVVFVTYNRLVTLKPTIETFLANTDYPRERLELIVADDASDPAVQKEIRKLPFDVFRLSDRRGGMGANTNRGLAAASGDFVLQLQDDWECTGPRNYLRHVLHAMTTSPQAGVVLLRPRPNTVPLHATIHTSSGILRLYENRLDFTSPIVGNYAYSDWPHLKPQSFIREIGPYREGCPMWETELDYARRVNAQGKWFVADLPPIDAFRHIGDDYSYNRPWKKRVEHILRKAPAGAWALSLYRRAKKLAARRMADSDRQ